MEANHISFSYDGKKEIIKDVSFTLQRNKITTLMGANGCGKSTLFHLLTKTLTPQKGRVLLEGKEVSQYKMKEFARNVAIVHQNNSAPADLKVSTLVSYGRIPFLHYRMSLRDEDEKIINEALAITGLTEFKDYTVGQLSGGQRQRVWIAMALAQSTDILFLDEPTTYLDIRYQIEILRLIQRLNQEKKMTIVMVLHDINQAIHYSDIILGMKEGRILFEGRPDKVVNSEFISELYSIDLPVVNEGGGKFVLTV
ncbi:MAG: ABC transporter ATP-binding protein [Filifactor alocis]|nr:ABC transporter ATP-binding protein [Filifactor alocis]